MISTLYKSFQKWSAQGTVWLYSDPHFGDEELRESIPNRPTDEEQIRMINSKVGKKDTFICLGDVGDPECARRIKGYKVLVMGNHDAGRTVYEEIFDEVYSGPLMIAEKILLSHEPIDISWAVNIHGHDHNPKNKDGKRHLNCCSDVINYTPINFNQWIKSSGQLKNATSIHRETINKATKRKKKRKKNV